MRALGLITTLTALFLVSTMTVADDFEYRMQAIRDQQKQNYLRSQNQQMQDEINQLQQREREQEFENQQNQIRYQQQNQQQNRGGQSVFDWLRN